MRDIQAADITREVAKACVRAACDLPADVQEALESAAQREQSVPGKWALDKICRNAKAARKREAPLCQDTGLVVAFADVGQDVHIVGNTLEQAINDGVAQGYVQGYLRASLVADPLLNRTNTNDNTPATIHVRLVEGDRIDIALLPKGGGSENMTRLAMLKPADGTEGVKAFVLQAVEEAGGNPCPPTIVGVGIGGNAEGALLLSKRALCRAVGTPHAQAGYAQLEQELLEAVNATGIGPQGFGGVVTALAVHIEVAPTHIASLPVAVTLQCHAARHQHIRL